MLQTNIPRGQPEPPAVPDRPAMDPATSWWLYAIFQATIYRVPTGSGQVAHLIRASS